MISKIFNIVTIILNVIAMIVWFVYIKLTWHLWRPIDRFVMFFMSLITVVLLVMAIYYMNKKESVVITNSSKQLMIISIIIFIIHAVLILPDLQNNYMFSTR